MVLHRLAIPVLAALTIAPLSALAKPAPLEPPAAARLLPVDTAGVFFVNTKLATWETLGRFGLFPADVTLPEQTLVPGLSFATDIQPWIGDKVAIALLPSEKGSPATGAVLVAPVKEAKLIPQFLDRLKAAKGPAPITREYKGITILEWPAPKPDKPEEPEAPGEAKPQTRSRTGLVALARQSRLHLQAPPAPTPEASPNAAPEAKPETAPESEASADEPDNPFFSSGLAVAVLPGYLLAASTAQPIEAVIDTRGKKSLLEERRFQRMMQNPQFAQSLMVAYGNMPRLLDWAESISDRAPTPPPTRLPIPLPLAKPQPEAFTLLRQVYDSAEIYAWAQPEGLRIQSQIYIKGALSDQAVARLTSPNQIVNRLPGVTHIAANSANLAAIVQPLIQALDLSPETRKPLEAFRRFSRNLVGVDDRDILPWMDGEYAFFLFPSREGPLAAWRGSPELGLGIAVQTGNRAAAEAALRKLDQFVGKQTRGGVAIVRRQVKGRPVMSWEVRQGSQSLSILAHSWVAPDTVLILSGVDQVASLSPQPRLSLAQSGNFRDAIAPLPQPNQGYFYVNMGSVLSVIYNSVLPAFLGPAGNDLPMVTEIKDRLATIRSFSSAGSFGPDKAQSDSFLALATTRSAPPTAEALFELGLKRLEEENYHWAITNFSRVLALEPENGEAYFNRAIARDTLGDKPGALTDYSEAIRINPEDPDGYYSRANVRTDIYDYQGALVDLAKALELKPDLSDAYSLRAAVRVSLEDYKGAIEDANKAIKLNPEDGAAYSNRCYARARGLGEFKVALEDCERAREVDREEIFAAANYTSRCYIRANLGEKDALDDCEQALKANPDYTPYVYEDRGLARLALGDKPGALADWKQAIEAYTQEGDAVSVERVQKLIRKHQ